MYHLPESGPDGLEARTAEHESRIDAEFDELIAAEAIASTEGLGYRIFLVRRYLAMDVILPYVAWITVLAFSMDWLLRRLRTKAFAWAKAGA